MSAIVFSAKLEVQWASPYWIELTDNAMLHLPEIEVSDVETTTVDQTGRWKQYRSGLYDGGSVSAEIHFTASLYETLLGKLGSTYAFRITTPDDEETVCTFSAHIKKVSVDLSPGELMKVKLDLKVTGAVASS